MCTFHRGSYAKGRSLPRYSVILDEWQAAKTLGLSVHDRAVESILTVMFGPQQLEHTHTRHSRKNSHVSTVIFVGNYTLTFRTSRQLPERAPSSWPRCGTATHAYPHQREALPDY